jgi:hypothetical protein
MAKEDLNISKAHPLIPYPFGLLSVASVSEYTEAQDHWARYTAHEFNSKAFALRLLTINDDTVTNGELHDSTIADAYSNRFLEYIPFGIEVEDYASALGIVGQDRFERVLKILEAASGKAVERELWEGLAAQEATNSNSYLADGNSTTVSVTTGGDVPRLALARLEGALADCPSGLKGTIHMSRKMAMVMYDQLERVDWNARLDRDDVTEKGYGTGQILVTKLGTPVVVGTGYTGLGPAGATGEAVTNTTEWIYGTGYCDVHLGSPKVVNEDLARSFTVSSNTNDARIKALRTAAVHFENCCHYAARVDYSASV